MAAKGKKKTTSRSQKTPTKATSLPSKRFSAATAAIVVLCAFAATQFDHNKRQQLHLYIDDTLASLSNSIRSRWSTKGGAGYFPDGCRWRDAALPSGAPPPAFWEVRNYEYWNETQNAWSSEQPPACLLQPVVPPPLWQWANDSRTGMECIKHHCIVNNVWYNQGRFFYLTDDENGTDSITLLRDITLSGLVVKDAAIFPSLVDARRVPGDTLLIDFMYFIHPTAIGHWLEHLLPLVTALRQITHEETQFSTPPSQILVLHLKRTHIMEWVRAAIAAAINVPPNTPLPPLILQEEVGSIWNQLGTTLEGIPDGQWLCFDKILIVRDTYSKGLRVAELQEDAHAFRERTYRLYNMEPPPGSLLSSSSSDDGGDEDGEYHAEGDDGGGNDERTGAAASSKAPSPKATLASKTITLFRKSSNRRILNEAALLKMLRRFGPVRVVEFTAETPFQEQLRIMATTVVLVSVHTSALANAMFLPPGAAVVELIHRNWVWYTLDQSFKVQSDAMGDIHHFAWRAVEKQHGQYINPRDEERFGGDEWSGVKCDTDDCVEAHTNVDVIADIDAIQELLEDRLPLIWAGVPVNEAKLPWPPPN